MAIQDIDQTLRLFKVAQDKKKIQDQTVDVVRAKVSASADPLMASSASLIASVQKEDALQVSADALKLGAAALDKASSSTSAVANSASATASVITSVNKAAQGDTYSALSAASAAIEKSATLSKSPIAAVANALVLGAGRKEQVSQTEAVKESAERVFDTNATGKQRLKATLDLTTALQGLANLYRSLGNAAWKLGNFVITKASKVAKLAPGAAAAKSGLARLAVTPLGKFAGFANKWLPFLNIAGVAVSTKTALEVRSDKQASTTSKVLAGTSVAMAVGSLVAGFTLKGLPFIGVIASAIATDVALASARHSDAKGEDTDAKSRHWLTHPFQAAGALTDWISTAIPQSLRAIKTKLTSMWGREKAAA